MYTPIRALAAPVNTTIQLQTLLTLISLPSTEKVDLFAGRGTEGAATVIVVARGRFAGIGPAEVVYDALTLSVGEQARYAEMRELLDLAVASKKCYVSSKPASASAHLPPEQAIALLRGQGASELLTHHSRPAFFALLSDVREADITDFSRPG
ncbi:hypothetical protein KY495_09290 [Massilia sp. PAMC28688]|uniref:hypothetical protein n=1 Tax=Massilia sp. PAMC28688 TaxID=2861283 RepID=UPI001C62585A|nr:hypothetical protein [Massilia sp. PAMC28688]QYF95321.1 hypothetical protein KY495_09290 [Massilia sp. PAMC28688]